MNETPTNHEIDEDDDAEYPDECIECGEVVADDESKHDRYGQAYCPNCWEQAGEALSVLTNHTTYTVADRTRRVFRLTPTYVWFREEDNGLTVERIMGRALFEKWLRGVKRG